MRLAIAGLIILGAATACTGPVAGQGQPPPAEEMCIVKEGQAAKGQAGPANQTEAAKRYMESGEREAFYKPLWAQGEKIAQAIISQSDNYQKLDLDFKPVPDDYTGPGNLVTTNRVHRVGLSWKKGQPDLASIRTFRLFGLWITAKDYAGVRYKVVIPRGDNTGCVDTIDYLFVGGKSPDGTNKFPVSIDDIKKLDARVPDILTRYMEKAGFQ